VYWGCDDNDGDAVEVGEMVDDENEVGKPGRGAQVVMVLGRVLLPVPLP
jgi:hypothetical protein